ncbi:hypothetical protein [Natrarchaeobius oligotrophus]|uniref:Uncharacterized protein n=1 Tax=Natrarchaeobius chitinivorans TaxID=1679083 RepID=A0A3N6NGI2_NATCH|nr:hypothetical protein [Natrarchaeobius chitinivorans]RQG98142.1 hypothetical protein EA472_18420 [Natrarchaeobius chitinivorans]
MILAPIFDDIDRTERATIGLTAAYLATLSAVWLVDEPIVWLAWAIGAVAVSGAAMIVANRIRSIE